jgi:hypothetical protein
VVRILMVVLELLCEDRVTPKWLAGRRTGQERWRTVRKRRQRLADLLLVGSGDAPHSASHSSPDFRFRSESDQRSAGQVQEAAVVRHRLAPKKTAQQGKCVVCQCLVDERMLTLQRLGSATTGLLIVIERRIDDLGEKLRNGAKPVGLMSVGPIERLSKDELPRIGIVAEIEPVSNAAPRGRERVMYFGSGSAAIDATDDEIKIVG